MSSAPPRATSSATGEGGSPLEAVQALLRELPGLVGDRVRLLSLEMRRAGQALALIVALLTVAAVLASTAWLAMWAALFAALVHAGLAWGWAALVIIVVNVLAAVYAVKRAVALGPLLALPATVRQLTTSVDEVGPPEPPGLAEEPEAGAPTRVDERAS